MDIKITDKLNFGMGLKIKDKNGVSYNTEFKETKQNENGESLLLECEHENAENFKIDVQRGKNHVLISVNAELKSPESWANKNSFFINDSITLSLKPSQNRGEILVYDYFLYPRSDGWISTYFTNRISDIKNSAQSVFWRQGDFYYHLMPLCDGDFKASLTGGEDTLFVTISPEIGGYEKINSKAAVITYGNDPFEVMKSSVYNAAEALGKTKNLMENKRVGEMFDYLGWCTWETFHHELNSKGIIEKSKEFCDKKIPIRWTLLDDGWFEFEDSKLKSFHEDRKKFPEGLKAMIDNLKENYNMKWVGAWQCFAGLWNGIHPDSYIAREMGELVMKTTGGRIIPRCDVAGNTLFWDTWNEYLSGCGVDFVKVDVESVMTAYTYSNIPIGKAVRDSHTGLEASVSMYYDGNCINCTAMDNESMFVRQRTSINRNSNDFLPNDVSTMPGFVRDNIYNAFFHSNLYCPDFDMMWSDSKTTKLNTVMHAVSGGPVYISDLQGESSPEVINAFADSTGKLYKCDEIALPVRERVLADPVKTPILMKVQNTAHKGGILAVFNLYEKNEVVGDYITPSDIMKLPSDKEKYLCYSHFGKKAFLCGYDEKVKYSLPQYDCELFCIVPVENNTAVIGLCDKYVSTASVTELFTSVKKSAYKVSEGGKFAYWCGAKHEIFANGKKVEPTERENYYIAELDENEKDIFVEIYIMINC